MSTQREIWTSIAYGPKRCYIKWWDWFSGRSERLSYPLRIDLPRLFKRIDATWLSSQRHVWTLTWGVVRVPLRSMEAPSSRGIHHRSAIGQKVARLPRQHPRVMPDVVDDIDVGFLATRGGRHAEALV